MAMNPRLLRPTTSGRFDPRKIAGLGLWLDAADTTTVSLDGSDNVEEWRDKSGFDRHATQTTGANRPDYASTLNGRKVVTFAGSPEGMTGENPTPGGTLRTVFVVFSAEQGGSNSTETPLALGDILGIGRGFAVTKEIGVRVGSGSRLFGDPVSATSIVTISATTGNVSGLTARKNGQNLTPTATVEQTLDSGAGYSVGQGLAAGAASFLFGSVAEAVVYTRILAASEVAKVESYLSSKWGIALA
jgi:hypothetical protein